MNLIHGSNLMVLIYYHCHHEKPFHPGFLDLPAVILQGMIQANPSLHTCTHWLSLSSSFSTSCPKQGSTLNTHRLLTCTKPAVNGLFRLPQENSIMQLESTRRTQTSSMKALQVWPVWREMPANGLKWSQCIHCMVRHTHVLSTFLKIFISLSKEWQNWLNRPPKPDATWHTMPHTVSNWDWTLIMSLMLREKPYGMQPGINFYPVKSFRYRYCTVSTDPFTRFLACGHYYPCLCSASQWGAKRVHSLRNLFLKPL